MMKLALFYTVSLLISFMSAQSWHTSACSSKTFNFPSLFGSELLHIAANKALNHTTVSLPPGTSEGGLFTIDFCNVTVTYTHPGWNDIINVQVWLPLDPWTGRLQALGGGGYSATLGGLYLAQAVAKGDVAIGTDSGHQAGIEATQSPASWALTSPGNVNLYLFENFASRSLHEMAVIGKSITKDFYGVKPKYSYFTGCSQGGRQGLTIAQKYAEDFDGILASAPAINGETFITAANWAQQTMKNLQYWPSPCEIDAFTQAAIKECDALDGAVDGIISDPAQCHFQASSVIGKKYKCKGSGTSHLFSRKGAQVVQAAWDGPRKGNVGWYGLNKDASLTSTYIRTQCSPSGTCKASPIDLLSSWITYFVAKDPQFNATKMSDNQFFSYIKQSKNDYQALIGAADPDLSEFRQAGGKMITWHGLSDEIIPPNGTFAYYQRVLEMDPAADTFYRAFEAPGVGHCFGGKGPIPDAAFDQLVAWVENKTFPETLIAVDSEGHRRRLCALPLQQVYIGGDVTDADSFVCQKRMLGSTHNDMIIQLQIQQ